MGISFSSVVIPAREGVNVILGQTHFMKSIEDLYEVLVSSVPGIKFGAVFCEASGPRLIRHEGNEPQLRDLAIKTAEQIGAGHVFIIFIKEAYPINVLNQIKNIQEVCNVFAASANQVEVIIAESSNGRGVVGVIDGGKPLGVENPSQREERIKKIREFGYKLE